MNNRGVTLIELLIVVAIIGILAAISIPAYIGQQKSAQRHEAESNLQSLRLLEEQVYAENGEYTTGTLGTCAPNNPGNIATIHSTLKGFKPGSELAYSYCLLGGKFINTTSNTLDDDPNCFVGQAFGNSNSRVSGEQIWLDCNNNWHYQQ